MKRIPLGIQVFTVREELKKDFRGTVLALADMGYDGVELGGDTGGMEPDELAAFLKSAGLAVAGMHVSTADLLDPGSKMYTYAVALSSPYLSTSRDREVTDKWPAVIKELSAAAETAASKGFQFTYHNHAAEFTRFEGRYGLDMLFDSTDPESVKAELDTFWIKKGGADPVGYIRKYAGRVPQVHLKDMDGEDGSFTEIGAGIIDIAGIYEVARETGVEWMIYEQDRWKRPAMESARMSIEHLKKAGLA